MAPDAELFSSSKPSSIHLPSPLCFLSSPACFWWLDSPSIFYQDCHFSSGCGGSPHFPAHTYPLTTPPGTAPLFSASRGRRYYNKQSMPLASMSPCIYAKRIPGGGGKHLPSPKEGPQELSGCHPTSREEGRTVTKLEGAVDGFMCGPRVAKSTAGPPS